MEAFAGFLSHADAQVGRVLDWLDRLGDLGDTLVVALSDNGASSEGGPVGSLNDARLWNALPRTVDEAVERIDEIGEPRIHNNYPWGWTVAGNTPLGAFGAGPLGEAAPIRRSLSSAPRCAEVMGSRHGARAGPRVSPNRRRVVEPLPLTSGLRNRTLQPADVEAIPR